MLSRKAFLKALVTAVGSLLAGCGLERYLPTGETMVTGTREIALPPAAKKGNTSVEEAILHRRSVRSYKTLSLSLPELSQLLWAAQGTTSQHGLRAAPSAGALYPLEVFIVVGERAVDGLEPGLYHYEVSNHSLTLRRVGDQRSSLAEAALSQECVARAPVSIVICAVYERLARKYGNRAERYAHLETGHVAENVCLQATALGLGAVTVGAFSDEGVAKVTTLPAMTKPIYIIPVGKQ